MEGEHELANGLASATVGVRLKLCLLHEDRRFKSEHTEISGRAVLAPFARFES